MEQQQQITAHSGGGSNFKLMQKTPMKSPLDSMLHAESCITTHNDLSFASLSPSVQSECESDDDTFDQHTNQKRNITGASKMGGRSRKRGPQSKLSELL